MLQDKEKIAIVDTIIKLHPQLKKNRINIINEVLGRKEKVNNDVYDKFIHNGKILYRDASGKILDENIIFKGCCAKKGQDYVYYFPDEQDLETENELINQFEKLAIRIKEGLDVKKTPKNKVATNVVMK